MQAKEEQGVTQRRTDEFFPPTNPNPNPNPIRGFAFFGVPLAAATFSFSCDGDDDDTAHAHVVEKNFRGHGHESSICSAQRSCEA